MLIVVLVAVSVQLVEAQDAGTPDTVHVAAPTGERETDRASIVAALERVRPGGTVQFAAGTYLVGGGILVTVPGITLLGHSEGTALRGCEPGEAVDYEGAMNHCVGLQLSGGHQTVRNLTFERMSWASLRIAGPRVAGRPGSMPTTEGGHLIEGNTFRDSDSFDVISDAAEPIVIRHNAFINTYHAVAIQGRNVHFVDNRITAPAHDRIPYGRADIAIGVAQFSESGPPCADNVIAGNHMEGHSDGIALGAFSPGTSRRDNVIRDNTIVMRPVVVAAPERSVAGGDADSLAVGIALRVLNYPRWCLAARPADAPPGPCPPDETGRGAVLADNIIEGNRIVGVTGIAVEMLHASGNRILNNTVSAVARWDRFPDGVLRHDPEWHAANGSGIWVSPGSDENEIAGNTFEDVAAHAMVLEGARNRVETRRPTDVVRDLGRGNRVTSKDGPPDPVHVAPPTGEKERDRASILAALEQVRPGGTVQFGAGTYLVGEIIRVSTSNVTLLGHGDGTTLRGCDPQDFVDPYDFFSCNGLELAGARQTVRGFTFEHAYWAVHLGGCFGERATLTLPDGTSQVVPALYRTAGGHRVEENTFRSTANGVRVNGDWTEPAIVRNNRFVNNWHAVSINGHTVHLLDNHISVPEPHLVPFHGFAWDGIKIAPTFPLQDLDGPQTSACIGNIVEGNHVEGHLDGVRIELYFPGTSCRENVVRGNTIIVRRLKNPLLHDGFTLRDPSDSTFVGVPIALLNEPAAFQGVEPGPGTAIEDNVIAGNRIIGAEGIAMEVLHASRNRIVNNTITGVVAREPFPGNTMGTRGAEGMDFEWHAANGSGIWVSPGSDENEIAGNTFENIAVHAVVLEGDHNRVELRSAGDAVRDLGSGNRVVAGAALPAVHDEVEALTARFVRALNDESWRLLAPFYSPGAVLTLAGGEVLEGRQAILDYFRPLVARIRGVEATSSRMEEDERGVTVTTTYTARLAPVPDPVSASFSNSWARQPDGGWLIVSGTFELPGDPDALEQGTTSSGFFHSDGVRLHYLDFGGEGVPVLFISSGDRTAYAFVEFAPRFTDRHRVLALSQRGAGPSEGDPAPVVGRDVLGRDIIALLDALDIERAVVAHMWEHVLVYLAEEHPERVAGLVFLEGFPPRDVRTEDPLGIFAMLARNRAAIWGADPQAALASDYEPRFLGSGEAVTVPSLLFVDENRTEESEWEQLVEFARFAGRSPALFPDPVARTYFQRLAGDEELQERGRTFWRDTVVPAQRTAEEAFHRAFGSVQWTVRVESRAIGYGYRDAPELIYPHIRAFLHDIGRPTREGYAPGADNVRLYYRFEGQGPDTVVVLHGGPSLGFAYLAPDMEDLGRELTLLHYDQRGVGRSTLPPGGADLAVARHVADLEALRGHFGLDRLVLLGHSWGAMLAAHYAAAHPERVARMLFIDPMAPAAIPYMAQAGARARLLMEERLDEAQRVRLDSLALSWAEAEDPEAHCRAVFGILMRVYFADAGGAERTRGDFCAGSADVLRARPDVDESILGELGDWDVRPLLPAVGAPVLILHGAESAIPLEAMQAWVNALPNARLQSVPDAGHYLHVDRPEVFFPVALEFLGGRSPAGALSFTHMGVVDVEHGALVAEQTNLLIAGPLITSVFRSRASAPPA
jgi:proline-specific peptidase